VAIRILLIPEVKQDIAEVYTWYQNQRTGLGEESLHSIEASLEAIRRQPELRAPMHESYRRAMVQRFPYCIFYEFETSTVTVYSIIHTARDPAKWRARLP
jgi:plasmid stabilization system protein ParE